MKNCESQQNACGFRAQANARATLTDCRSIGDGEACSATDHNHLIGMRVAVRRGSGTGFVLATGASAQLTECSAAQCGKHGVCVRDRGSKLEMMDGLLDGNTECGILVDSGAEGVLSNVRPIT